MDEADRLLLKADSLADGFIAEAMQDAGEQLDAETVSCLRSAFTTGWLMGYRTAIQEGLERV